MAADVVRSLESDETQAVMRLTGDYAGDVAIYDEIVKQALGMADMMADGILRQFPAQFSQ